jgi:membrane dipeptidase
MDRRKALKCIAATAVAPAVLRRRYALFAATTQEYSARAVRLVEESPVIDMLCQFRFPDFTREGGPIASKWLRDPAAFTEEDFERYRSSGVNVFALGHGADDYEAGLEWCAEWNGFIAAHSDWFARIDEPRDFESVVQSGKVGIMLTMQNSTHIREADDVDTFFGLGQRVSQLTYNFSNGLGSGFLENHDGGLTARGERIVERMEAVGMAVDASHCGDRTTLDILKAATRPVIFTHASCRALLPGHLRCKTDEMIRGLAGTGGVMGIPFIRFMIRQQPPVNVEHVLDHFDHVARLVGVEHVGIGSDLDLEGLASPRRPRQDGGEEPESPLTQPNIDRYQLHFSEDGYEHVDGLNHPKRAYDLTEGLIRRGYGDDEIRLMLGGNFARVLADIWAGD